MKILFLIISIFSTITFSQNLKEDGTPYFVPQRANIFVELPDYNNFYINLTNKKPFIKALNKFIFETRFTTKYQINNAISNYNGKPYIITSTFATFNDSLQLLDSMTRYTYNNILEKYWVEDQFILGRSAPNSEHAYGYFPNNPQKCIFIPLNDCSIYVFYSSYGFTKDFVWNSVGIKLRGQTYYSSDNHLRDDDGASGSLIYKKNEYINKKFNSGQERFFFNERESITAMLTGVQHKNNTDYWVIYHKNLTNYFSVHLVKADGQINDAIKSYVGFDFSKPYPKEYPNNKELDKFENELPMSNIRPSPNGKYLAQTQLYGEMVDTITKKFACWATQFKNEYHYCFPGFPALSHGIYEKRPFLLFKFDNSTGIISDEILMNRTAHATEFSPNSRYLYITSIDGMYVYDLKDWDRTKIIASEKKFDELGVWSSLYMGPDGRLWGMNYMNDTIYCIPNPNDFENIKIEKYCVLDLPSNSPEANITLSNMMKNRIFYPPMPNLLHHYPMNEYYSNIKFEILGKKKYCVGDTIILNAQTENYDGGMDAYWTKPNGMKVISSDFKLFDVTALDSGWYKYNLESECDGSVVCDSIHIEIIDLQPTLSTTQNTFCEGDSATISLDKDYETVLWNTSEITKDIVVKTAGIYSATVTEGECSNTASIEIKVNPLPDISIKAPNGLLLCNGGSVEIEIVVDPAVNIKWNDGTKIRKRQINASGTYTIYATDLKTGCESIKEIIISDMDDLQDEILGNPAFCEGESTTLTLNPEAKTYLWNTGATSRSIVVNQSGNYSATLTTEAGCEMTAKKEVTKYPLPDFEILGETIICENPVALYPNKDFVSYEWNTGETSKTITIENAGNYWLKVTDENGCETTKYVEVKQANPELNLSTNNIGFGEILFGNSKTRTITADRNIIITKNTTKFNASISNNNINIIFKPTNIGEYIDTLIVETEGDCKASDTIYIKGICKAEILASVSNAEGYQNDNITNQVSLELQQEIPLPIDFNYNITLNINEDAIYITDNTTYTYASGKLIIDIQDYLNKTEYNTKIKDINSKINLARNHDNPIKIINFTTDNEYLIPLRKDGNIIIYEVCLDSMRLIENYTPANIQTLNKNTLTLSTYHTGTYKIEISDIAGKSITNQTQTTNDNETITFNYKLSNGTYLIKITEPGKIQTIKVIFVE